MMSHETEEYVKCNACYRDGQGFKGPLVFVDLKDQRGSRVKGAFQGPQAPLVHLETLE